MSPVKRYLLIFFGVYIGGALLANFLWGPPGLSREYEKQYGKEHEHYLEIIKSDAYKLYAQRPELNPLDPALVTFVGTYTGREAFKKEEHRQAIYHNFFEFFQVIMVLTLVVHFARKPLLNFLDAQIAEVRTKLERVEQARQDAAQRKQQAEEKARSLPDAKERTARETEALIARERARFEEMARFALETLDKETEDRKQEEQHAAALRVKQELVGQSIDLFVAQYKATVSPEAQAAQTDRFIRDVGARA